MTTTALDRLDELAAEVDQAKGRLAELEQQRRSGARTLESAIAGLRDYHRAVEAGDVEADSEEEQRLQKALRQARGRVAPKAAFNPRAGIGDERPLELVDPELEGRISGARDKVNAVEAAYERFRSSHFDDLVVELGALGVEYAEKYELAAKHAKRGAREWRMLRNRWRPIVEIASFDWRDFPRSPFDAVELEPLMPKQVAEGGAVQGPLTPRRKRR